MSTTRENLLKSALELPESERLLLATELLETVADDELSWSLDDPALVTELEKREQDGSRAISWESVQAQLRADLQS